MAAVYAVCPHFAQALDPVSSGRPSFYNQSINEVAERENDSGHSLPANYISDYLLYWQKPQCIVSEITSLDAATQICTKNQDAYTLKPGEYLLLRLPPATTLRISSADQDIAPADVELEVSNGSGLFHQQKVKKDMRGKGLIFTPIHTSSGELYRIRCPLSAQNKISLRIHTLRTENILPPAHNLNERPIGFRKVAIKGTISDRKYLGVSDALQESTTTVQGPADIILEHHPLYYEDAVQRKAEYRISTVLTDVDDDSVRQRRIFEFTNLPEQNQLMTLEDTPFTMGRLQRSLISIPKGEFTLKVRATRPIAARLLGDHKPSYLLGRFNEPDTKTSREKLYQSLSGVAPAWGYGSLESADNTTGMNQGSVAHILQSARLLSVDNHYQPAGLIASDLLQNTVLHKPEFRPVLAGSPDVIAPNTFYRNLLPQDKIDNSFQQKAWFVTPRLKNELDRHLVIGSHHITDIFQLLSRGIFTKLVANSKYQSQKSPPKSIRYNLPPRASDSLLRVVVPHPNQKSSIIITMDNGETHQLQLQTSPQYPASEYKLSLPEIGLNNLYKRFRHSNPTTLGGGFGLFEEPGDLIQVAFAEIPLPKEVRFITLHLVPSAMHSLDIALQYRDAKFHTLTEADFLVALELIGGRSNLLTKFNQWLQGKREVRPSEAALDLESLAMLDLENDYFTLLTFLKSLIYTYTASISSPSSPEHDIDSLSEGERRAMISSARQAEDKEQWLAALELWASIEKRSIGSTKVQPALGYNRALINLGQHHLAEMLLKGMYLYPHGSGSVELAKMAYQQLIERYETAGKEDKLLGLYAVEYSRTGKQEVLQAITRLVAENDQPRYAMLLSILLLQQDMQPDELLYATLQLGWRKLFTRSLYKITNPEDFNYFQALLKIQDGDSAKADALLEDGGQRGKLLLESRNKAKEIVKMFTLKDWASVQKGWQAWQKAYPGPHVWKEKISSANYAGTAMLRSRMRYLYGQYYRSDPEKAVTIQVTGPTELRFTVRPLHSAGQKEPLSTWLEISDGEKQTVKSIHNNFPSQTIEVANDDRFLAGQKNTTLYKVAEGEHLLEIKGLNVPLLIQIEQKLPVLGCEFLPILSTKTFAAAKSEHVIRINPYKEQDSIKCLFEICAKEVSHQKISSETENQIRQKLSTAQKRSFVQTRAPNPIKPQLSQERLKKQSLHCLHDQDGDKEQCLATLAKYSSNGTKEEKHWSLVNAVETHIESGKPDQLSYLMSRPEFKRSWQPVELIRAEEGFRFVKYSGWQPQSPFLRIRKTMLPPLNPGEQILYDGNNIVFATNSRQGYLLSLKLRLLEVPYLPRYPLTLLITQKGDQKDREIAEVTLDGDKNTVTMTVPVAAGASQLVFSIKKRYTNQFLAIQADVKNTGLEQIADLHSMQSVEEQERSYYVASDIYPLLVDIDGPALIRIDRLDDNGRTYTKYRYISDNWHEISVYPEKGERTGLFRVYRLELKDDTQPEIALLRPPVQLKESFPQLETEIIESAHRVILPKQSSEIQNSGGTIELGVRYQKRRDFEEDSADKDEYFEAYATQRLKADNMNGYFQSTALWRLPDEGGQVVGLREKFTWMPRTIDATMRFEAQAFAQNPQDQSSDFSWPSDEYSFFLRTSVSKKIELSASNYHIPSFSLFKRYMSLDNDQAYPADHIDSDIYSSYKADHLDGVRFAETYYFRPWLDTLWFGGASVTSNQWPDYYDPDNIKIRAGWQQLIGDVEAGLSYRGAYYFTDKDRTSNQYRDGLQLDVSLNLYRKDRQKVQLSAMVRHDLYYNDFVGFLSLSYYFNETPDYRNFSPGEIQFKDTKQYRRHQNLKQQQEY